MNASDTMMDNFSKKSVKKNKKQKLSESAVEAENNLKRKKLNTESNEPEILHIKPLRLHDEKKKMVAQIKEMQEILGAAKPPDEKEAELELLVFGCQADALEEEDEPDVVPDKTVEKVEPKPAWEDEDDETILVKEKARTLRNCHRSVSLRGDEKYSDLAQEKFIKLMGAPKWAELRNDDEKNSDDESEDELLQKTGNFITQSEYLPKGNIHVHKCPSLVDPSMKASVIKSVEFHPTSRVALVATTSGTANLFQVDGKINAKIQSIHFQDFPIHTAHFTVDGSEIVVGSNVCAHFFSYDMLGGKITRIPWQKGMNQENIRRFQMSPDGKYIVINGRYGNIHLMTSKSREWVGSLKMNGEVIAITFNRDGSRLYSHGGTGEVYVWDMSTRKCIHKFVDEGCISGTALTISPNDQFLVTGSDSGVVNIYDNRSILSTSTPQPLKVLLNLTTEITQLKFNNTSELLCMSSFHKAEAMKLVHFPSLTVFSNFPPRGHRHMMKRPNSADISINSGYMCIGNNVGTAYLYRLKHFKNY